MRLAFVTNNAARPPHAVAEHLTELGHRGRARTRCHLGPGRGALSRRPPARPARACWWSARPGSSEALRERGLHPVGTRGRPGRRRRAGLLARAELAAAGRGRGRDQPRGAVGRDEPRPDRAVAARAAAGQRVAGRGAAARHRRRAGGDRQARPDDAPRVGRCAPRRERRSWSATGSTPTSRARTRSAARACSCSRGVTDGRRICWPPAPKLRPTYLAADVERAARRPPGGRASTTPARVCGGWQARVATRHGAGRAGADGAAHGR